MDLLESLDDVSTHRRTFKKQIDIQIDTQPIDSNLNDLIGDDLEVDEVNDDHLQGASAMIRSIQRRLDGDILETQVIGTSTQLTQIQTQLIQTQLIQTQQTQVVNRNLKLGTQNLLWKRNDHTDSDVHISAHTDIHTDTQNDTPSDTQNEIQKSDIIEDNQGIQSDIGAISNDDNSDIDSMHSDIDTDSEMAKSRRATKIAERAAAKKLLREQLEREKLVTAQQLDEFDDLENSKIVSSAPVRSKKDQKILRETRRLQNQVEFVPEPLKNKKFDKSKLFSAFNFQDPQSSSPIKENESPTPGTSPITLTPKKNIQSDSDSEELENVLDILDDKKRRVLNNPLKSYEERLNENTIDKRGLKVIELDSDPEFDTIDDLKQRTSKETRLDIKTKFVKRSKVSELSSFAGVNIRKFFPNIPVHKKNGNFVSSVNMKAARQLRDLMAARKLERGDDEKVEDESELKIQDLLEREIERNLRLKLKEKGKSKEKNDEIYDSSDGDYQSSDEEELVELQVKSSLNEVDEQDESENEEIELKTHHHRKLVLSDDDEDSVEDSIKSTQQFNNTMSFIYGVNDDAEHTRDHAADSTEFQMGSYGSHPNLKKMFDISMSKAFESTLPQRYDNHDLMNDLRKGQMQLIGDEEEEQDTLDQSKDSFLMVDSFNSTMVVQKLTQEEDESHHTVDKVSSIPLQTQKIMIDTQLDDDKVSRRRLVRNLEMIPLESLEEDEESDEETRKINLAIAKEKQRQKEIRRKRQLKEWKRKGVTAIVDDEASESDDEFHGLGGIDGDVSDREDSEDEKMLDDASKIDLKLNELRSKFAQESKQQDEKDVMKLFDDIRTGRLRKRRAGNSLDIELSEDEEDMKNFYLSRMNKQRNRLLQDQNIASIAANDKSKLFFETIAEKPVEFKLDDDDSGVEVIDEEEEDKKDEEDPFVEQPEPQKKKRKVKISHGHLITTLAEVCNTNRDSGEDQEQDLLFAKYQHGLTDEIEDGLDLLALKKQSSILMSTREVISDANTTHATQTTQPIDDDEFNPIRKSSIINSFRSYHLNSTSTGVKEVEVTISKLYKNSTGSKASIGYLANKSNLLNANVAGRTLKLRTIERKLQNHDFNKANGLRGVFKSGLFE